MVLSIYSGNKLSDFNFDNFLKDEKGRFIYINPNQNEIDAQIEEQSIVEKESNKEMADDRQKEIGLEENEAPLIEGLRFDKKDRKYFTEKDNDYGLEEDFEVGVFINGFVGLKPEIIKFLQNESNAQEKFKVPLPINFQEANDVKVEIGFVNILTITFSGTATVYSPVDGECSHGHGSSVEYGDYESLNLTSDKDRELQIRSKKIDFLFNSQAVKIGDMLAKIDKEVILDLNGLNKIIGDISNLSNEEILEMGLDNILMLGGTPVFVLPK